MDNNAKNAEQVYNEKFEQGKALGYDYETCVREAEKAVSRLEESAGDKGE